MSKKQSRTSIPEDRSKKENTKGKKRNKSKNEKTNGTGAGNEGNTANYGGNDVSWYTRYKDLTESAAKIPFAYQPGRRVPFAGAIGPDGYLLGGNSNAYADYDYPGIMTLSFIPSVGYSDTISSPINVAAKQMYGRVRSKYSGSLEADAPDLMMYCLAVDSLYMLLEDMKRAYYLVNQFTPYNTLYPKTIVQALGYDYEALRTNKVLMYQTIMECGAMLSKFMVPDNMNLYKRHAFMCANIYADAPTTKAQHYAFKLAGIYKLYNTDEMTKLMIAERPAQFCSVLDVRNWFMDAMSVLMEWDTSYTILGYLERAYEGEAFLAPSPVVQDGILSPIYNPEVLIQIQNATVAPGVEITDVTQDPTNGNMLIYTPKSNTTVPAGIILSLPTSIQPTPDMEIIATRLTTFAKEVNGFEGASNIPIDSGTEIINRIDIYVNQNGVPMSLDGDSIAYFRADADDKIAWSDFYNYLNVTNNMAAFSQHPTVYTYVVKGGRVYTDVFCDADNVTSVDPEDLANLHRMCIYSEFNCFEG